MKITVYDFGTITIDGETHTRDVIIHPGRIEGSWWRKDGHRLAVDDLASVWDERPDTLVVGTGYYGNMVVPVETLDEARARGIEIIAETTPKAVDIFNALSENPDRRAVAALHLTC